MRSTSRLSRAPPPHRTEDDHLFRRSLREIQQYRKEPRTRRSSRATTGRPGRARAGRRGEIRTSALQQPARRSSGDVDGAQLAHPRDQVQRLSGRACAGRPPPERVNGSAPDVEGGAGGVQGVGAGGPGLRRRARLVLASRRCSSRRAAPSCPDRAHFCAMYTAIASALGGGPWHALGVDAPGQPHARSRRSRSAPVRSGTDAARPPRMRPRGPRRLVHRVEVAVQHLLADASAVWSPSRRASSPGLPLEAHDLGRAEHPPEVGLGSSPRPVRSRWSVDGGRGWCRSRPASARLVVAVRREHVLPVCRCPCGTRRRRGLPGRSHHRDLQ